MTMSNLPAIQPSGNFYGTQLYDSEYRTWESVDGNSSQLVYHWDKLDANIFGPLQDIMIAVAKTHPNEENSIIKSMARAIQIAKKY